MMQRSFRHVLWRMSSGARMKIQNQPRACCNLFLHRVDPRGITSSFSTSSVPANPPNHGAAPPQVLQHESSMTENQFHVLADDTLEEICGLLETLEDMLEDVDVDLSQGVLTANLGAAGTWVLNKQSPNRQIWWSSPLSGPKRFEYHTSSTLWRNTRSPELDLFQLLCQEIQSTTGLEINRSSSSL